MRFSAEFLADLRSRANIVDIIDSVTPLKRTGKNHMGKCPMPDHDDRNPSFAVREDSQTYRCYSCGAHGDVFNFYQETRGLLFVDAVKEVANEMGVALPTPDNKMNDKTKAYQKLRLQLTKILSEGFTKNKERLSLPINDSLIKQLNPGYAADPRRVNGCMKKYREQLPIQELYGDKRNSKPALADSTAVSFPATTSTGRIVGFTLMRTDFIPHSVSLDSSESVNDYWVGGQNLKSLDKNKTLYVTFDFESLAKLNKEKPDSTALMHPALDPSVTPKQMKQLDRCPADIVFVLPSSLKREGIFVASLIKNYQLGDMRSVTVSSKPDARGFMFDVMSQRFKHYPESEQELIIHQLEEKGLNPVSDSLVSQVNESNINHSPTAASS